MASLVREASLEPNIRVIIYICPGGGGGSGVTGIGGTGGAGGVGGGVTFNFSPVVPNGTVSETAPVAPQPEPQVYGMVCLP
jgi:hypothetical protein